MKSGSKTRRRDVMTDFQHVLRMQDAMLRKVNREGRRGGMRI